MVSISSGNSKMGKIPSVSLPAGETCRRDAGCFKKCYARRFSARRPVVMSAYKNNLDILNKDPDIRTA